MKGRVEMNVNTNSDYCVVLKNSDTGKEYPLGIVRTDFSKALDAEIEDLVRKALADSGMDIRKYHKGRTQKYVSKRGYCVYFVSLDNKERYLVGHLGEIADKFR